MATGLFLPPFTCSPVLSARVQYARVERSAAIDANGSFAPCKDERRGIGATL